MSYLDLSTQRCNLLLSQFQSAKTVQYYFSKKNGFTVDFYIFT